jgi:chemotaxis signal transduction protein
MNTPPDNRVARLREEFDHAFTLPPAEPAGDLRDFVLVQLDEATEEPRIVALAAEGLCGIERVASVVPVPSRILSLEGIAGLHGAIVPVFRLQDAPAHMSERWHESPLLALAETGDPDQPLAAFAFERLEGFVRVPPQQIHADGNQARELLAWQNALIPVAQTAELLRALTAAQENPDPGTPQHGGL